MSSTQTSTVTFVSFNCKNVIRSVDCIRRLCDTADIVALQETWLLPHDISFLGTIDDNFAYTGVSAVDTSAGVLRGRPYGGVAILWRKSLLTSVSVIKCSSVRLAAIKIVHKERSLLVVSVYMPTDSSENIPEFTECLSEISAIVESSGVEYVYILGDFNAHPGERFGCELINHCTEQCWSCVDLDLLPANTYTFVSEAHGCRRWLDHCIVTSAARNSVTHVSVVYDTFWSDHYPVVLKCNIDVITPKIAHSSYSTNDVIWGERDSSQIDKYREYCHANLRSINFPLELTSCADRMCSDGRHRQTIDELYTNIICILTESAKISSKSKNSNKKNKHVIGWNKHVRDAHRYARECLQKWQHYGKPSAGPIYMNMVESRRVFKSKLKWCQNHQQQIKMDIIAEHRASKDFKRFWKATNKLSPKLSLPVSVAGIHEPSEIAKAFQSHFRVESPLGPTAAVFGDECGTDRLNVRFSAKDVDRVIKGMVRGKSPGHDHLSIEHLQCAGVHLPRVLSLLYNVFVPVIKNKSGDPSDLSNYRPISLATVVAKVLDSLLDQHLSRHVKLSDAQFGFQPGLSTESS
ncbi:hypothetical protein ABMA28_006666 [Loxostege sticticalis]|uniref:Endonuclease/exonuclease/phosphatase domain-containing protein n=1 Tax=Loxostege sticticalis TaxID=481309 RepID=A0ABD0TN05_LOXSC